MKPDGSQYNPERPILVGPSKTNPGVVKTPKAKRTFLF